MINLLVIASAAADAQRSIDGKRLVIYESAAKFESPAWTPGGDKLIFNEGNNMYIIPAKGGTPEQLKTMSAGTMNSNHGHAYSPDGKYVYCNENSTGTMQIWRMKKDGTAKEQLTFEEYHNWFPHISPNGKWMVLSSFPADIEAASAPEYKK